MFVHTLMYLCAADLMLELYCARERRFPVPIKSPYQIVLPKEQEQRLKHMARSYTLPYWQAGDPGQGGGAGGQRS